MGVDCDKEGVVLRVRRKNFIENKHVKVVSWKVFAVSSNGAFILFIVRLTFHSTLSTNGDPNYDIKRVKQPAGIPIFMLMVNP
ncbi:hypothetical protein RYX36_019152 [Vicia faba]